MMFRKKAVNEIAIDPIKLVVRNETILSGEKAPKSGYYIYNGHENPNEWTEKCFVTNRAKAGLYISEGSLVPDLGSCLHKIRWQFDQKGQTAITVLSGDKVPKSGNYVYTGHADERINTEGCLVVNKAKTGIYLMEGSKVPKTGGCSHQVKWQLLS